MTMNDYDATMIAEGIDEASHDEYVAAWQHLIDTGLAWRLQGWFGRTAIGFISNGICSPPPGWGSPTRQEMEMGA